MSEVYEFAKYVDVLVLFFLIYGLIINFLVTGIMELFSWIHKKWKIRSKKHKADSEQ